VQYGWKSYLINNDTSEVREVIGYQYVLTERFTNMSNGNWVYRVTGDEEFVSDIFTLNYVALISPVQLIEPPGGSFFNVHDYKYFETTSEGRFLYGLINKGETERYLDGNLNDVEYDTIEKAWYGDVGSQFPKKWNIDDGEPLNDVWPTTPNLPIQFWYNANDSLKFQFDDPYYEETDSIITSEPILTQVNNTYTIEVIGNDLLETKGWYFSINGSSFNFTTDSILTRPFGEDETSVSVTVQGTSGYEFTASINLVYVEPEYFMRIVATGGNLYGNYDYLYSSTTPSGNYLYSLVNKDTENKVSGNIFDVEYNPVDKKFYDVGSNVPFKYAQPNSTGELILSPFPTAANLEIHRFYDDDDVLIFKFDNPYYVAPAEPY